MGDIEEPVLYVRHDAYDYNGRRVTHGLPDPFVDSLTHNSIIVQIPRLHGKINNRLDKVLNIFDQSRVVSKSNQQTIDIDPAVYGGDNDMDTILRKLMEASCDKDVRREMDVEDEFFSVLKNREEEIMEKDRQLAQSKVAIKEAEEQRAQAEKRAERMMRNTIIALLRKQTTAEDIADMLGVDVVTVKQIAAEI